MNNVLIPEPFIAYDVDVSVLLYGEDSLPEDLDKLVYEGYQGEIQC